LSVEATLSDASAGSQETLDGGEATTAERCVAFCRGVVFTTTLVMLEGEVLAGVRPVGVLDAVVLVAAVYVVGTSLWSMLGRETDSVQFPLLVADMLMITGIILLAEGVASQYYLLYYMPILQASVRLHFRDAVASALLSSALYGFAALAAGPDTYVPTSAQLRAATFAGSALFMAVFFALLSREAKVHLKRSREMTELANALAAKNRELEERTRQLAAAQESVLASERLATIGELAASVGHELRNPLGVIRNAAYYLRTRLGDEAADVMEMVDLVDDEIGTCDRTIAALLDFARPDQGSPEPTDIDAVIAQAVKRLSAPAGVTVMQHIDEGLPQVLADPHQVEQVFYNIAKNAVQAMGDEGELTVLAGADDEGVFVSWQDTGPGISEESLEKVFDPLFTTKAKGIGLGLVVCKRLVERQGGRLDAASEVGKGATFTVRLREAGGTEDGAGTDGAGS